MLSRESKRLRLPLLIIVLCVLPTLVHAYTSGWIWMAYDSDLGYHSHYCADCFLYFYLPEPVLSYNITTGEWTGEKPVGWIYIDWPLYYELDTGYLWFALPPESGLWVYHSCPREWEVLPRIIP